MAPILLTHGYFLADDEKEPTVANLMRAGYRWKGRLVRAAMVTVRG